MFSVTQTVFVQICESNCPCSVSKENMMSEKNSKLLSTVCHTNRCSVIRNLPVWQLCPFIPNSSLRYDTVQHPLERACKTRQVAFTRFILAECPLSGLHSLEHLRPKETLLKNTLLQFRLWTPEVYNSLACLVFVNYSITKLCKSIFKIHPVILITSLCDKWQRYLTR